MRTLSRIGLCVTLALGAGVSAGAQQRASRGTGAVVFVPIDARVARLVLRATGPVSPDHRSNTSTAAGLAPTGGLLPVTAFHLPTEGTLSSAQFGFDSVHMAAVNRGLGLRALIDPVTRLQVADARRARQAVLAGGFVFPFMYNPVQVVIAEQPPVVIVQAAEPTAETPEEPRRAERARYREREHGPPPDRLPEVARPPQPVRELGEFVLIRRDGTLLFAVAYAAGQGRITYVTREGLRRTLPLAELDLEATAQINEQCGTTFRLPS